MALYKSLKNRLGNISEKPFRLEKDLQSLVEENLDGLMGLQLVKHEFSLKNRRIDTLAYDADTNAFVIIEYKRSKNYSVVDQGMAYLNLMLDNKAEFIVEYNESVGGQLKRSDIDWSQSRLIFVASGFTQNQKEAVNFRDFNIELYEIRRYDGDIVNVIRHAASGAAPSFKEVSGKSKGAQEINKELKTYTEADHFAQSSASSIELYESLKARILELGDDVQIDPKKKRISFKETRIFCDVHLGKGALKLWLNLKRGELDDPKGIARDVSSLGHWGNGDYEVKLKNEDEIDELMPLIRQAYKKQVL